MQVGMIATPSFLILSGILMGMLVRQARTAVDTFRTKLINRGLFLLLVAHALIRMALWGRDPQINTMYSTDAIGFATIVGVLVVPVFGKRTRLLIGGGLYVASWLAICYWHPGTWLGEATKELMVGSLKWIVWTTPVMAFLPWTGVYIAASVLGERIFELYRDSRRRRATLECVAISVTALSATVATKLGALWLHVSPLMGAVTSPLLRIGEKYPPGPLYLCTFGGVGLLILAFWMERFGQGDSSSLATAATILGESSLFVFVAHFYLFWGVLYALGPGGPFSGVLWFVGSATLLFWGAVRWRQADCNRYLTVRFDWVWRGLHRSTRMPSGMVAVRSQ
jgi:hypothetical protein